ncbi:MAG TPA: chorismate mutase [Globicatella sulfidifaciens]|nr:chorismate mutase [Globicatella sulfidifaciens]
MLEQQRAEIDQIDRQLVKLFEERMKVVEEVIEIKIGLNMEILDSSRESKVIEKAINRLENPELASEIRDFFTELMSISRNYQAKIRQNKLN